MKPVPFSQCGLWELQEQYYARLGVEAWSDRVPFYVTNSVPMAEAYADLIVAFLLDFGPLPSAEPLTLLELGSGTGRLAYYLERALARKLQRFRSLGKVEFRLVLTDLSEATLDFWDRHPRLQGPRFDRALFRADSDPSLTLRRSGETLARTPNPLIVLANYVFDSLPQDEFRARDGVVEECLVTLEPLREPVQDARDVRVLRSYHRVEPRQRYRDPGLRKLVQSYRRGSFTVPVAALKWLENLRRLGRLVLLSSDRGFTSEEHMTHYTEHRHELHEGAFSNLVNYPALAGTFKRSWMTRHQYLNSVHTMCGLDFEGPFEHLGYAFEEHLCQSDAINVPNEMFTLVRGKSEFLKNALPAFVRLNRMDPQAFSACAKQLADVIPAMNFSEASDLKAMLEAVWEQDYHFPGAPNLTFWLGHLAYGVGMYERSMDFFDRTMERTGVDEVLLFLKGNCLDALGRREEACDCYRRALERNPSFAEAQKALFG